MNDHDEAREATDDPSARPQTERTEQAMDAAALGPHGMADAAAN